MEKKQGQNLLAKKISEIYFSIEDYLSQTIDEKINNISKNELINPFKSSDFISVSSLPYMCAREEVLAAMHNVQRKSFISAELRSIFETGNAYQDVIRDLAFVKNAFLHGMWMCKKCNFVHGSIDGKFKYNSRGQKESELFKLIPCPHLCDVKKCDSMSFEYIELTLRNFYLKLKGHPDGIIMNKIYDHVLEIKTMNDFRFGQGKFKPFKEHIIQASLYAWMLNKKKILLLYFNKNNGRHLTWNLDLDLNLLKESLTKVKQIWKGVYELESNGYVSELPPRICESNKTSRAKKCTLCDKCFSTSY